MNGVVRVFDADCIGWTPIDRLYSLIESCGSHYVAGHDECEINGRTLGMIRLQFDTRKVAPEIVRGWAMTLGYLADVESGGTINLPKVAATRRGA